MKSNLHTIAILQLIFSCLHLLTILIISLCILWIPGFIAAAEQNATILLWIYPIALFFLILPFCFSITGIIGSIALIENKKWGKILILITSVVELPAFPLGTALGIYSIWAISNDKELK